MASHSDTEGSKMIPREGPKISREKFLPYIPLALVLAVVFYVRIRLLPVPLERDEGEFAYMGQLLLKGIPPFTHAYTMKLPGVSVMYALIMLLFGQTSTGIHTGLLIVNTACMYLVYLLSKRLFDNNAALFSCASYGLLSLSASVFGVFAHATHFAVLFALTGILLLSSSIKNRQMSLLLISGLCFGAAVSMKQHAVLFLIFAVLYFVWCFWKNPASDKKYFSTGSAIFLLSAITPYALIVLWMLNAGSFANFWFWTVQYAGEYSSGVPLTLGWNEFTRSFGIIALSQLPLWILAGSGGVLLCIKKRDCADRPFVFGFILFSLLANCPGLYFRKHYFILLLPAVAVLVGGGLSSVGRLFSSLKRVQITPLLPVFLLGVAVTYGFYNEREIFFTLTPLEVSRATYGANPFPESIQIANYIKNNTTPNDTIAVLGSEPEILFYADKLSATGHIYMYGLMEGHQYAERMQMQMIYEIEAARPAYIVFVNVETSWLNQESSVQTVFNWSRSYIGKQYDRVGVVDIIDSNTTHYLWEDKAVKYTPVSDSYITIFKKRGW